MRRGRDRWIPPPVSKKKTTGEGRRSLVDYSGQRSHTKHTTISVNPNQYLEYTVPMGYRSEGVEVASSILQRIMREYKSISKRVLVTGNPSYVHIAADNRYSLNRSDNVFGKIAPRDDDLSVELPISTLTRILKVTQFHKHVAILCEPGLPVCLRAPLGAQGGSRVDVFIHQTSGDAAAPTNNNKREAASMEWP